MRLVVALTGATGVVYGVNLLKALKDSNIEVHTILSRWAVETLHIEMGLGRQDIYKLASYCYDENDMAAPIASGSFVHQGMVVVPCSMKTLAGISQGFASNLILRAADTALKEGRRLILVPRETPLSAIHIENMLKLARLNVTIMPPMPAFYNHPETVEDIVNHTVSRIMDRLCIENSIIKRWGEE